MAFREFDGELDTPAGFVPFDGELDKPVKPAVKKDPSFGEAFDKGMTSLGVLAVPILSAFQGREWKSDLGSALEDYNAMPSSPVMENVAQAYEDNSGIMAPLAAVGEAVTDPVGVAKYLTEMLPAAAIGGGVGGAAAKGVALGAAKKYGLGAAGTELAANAAAGSGFNAGATALGGIAPNTAQNYQETGNVDDAISKGAKQTAAETGVAALLGAPLNVGANTLKNVALKALGLSPADETLQTIAGNAAIGKDTSGGEIAASAVLGAAGAPGDIAGATLFKEKTKPNVEPANIDTVLTALEKAANVSNPTDGERPAGNGSVGAGRDNAIGGAGNGVLESDAGTGIADQVRKGAGSNDATVAGAAGDGAIEFLQPSDYRRNEWKDKARAKGITDDAVLEEIAPKEEGDAVTGFHLASDKAPTVKRAVEFVKKTDADAHFIEADISNLGGLNSHFKNNHEQANKVYRQISDIFAEEMDKIGKVAVKIRHGGDEFNAVVIGAPDEMVLQAMQNTQARVAEMMQKQGLDKIPHPKHPDDLTRAGVGVYLGHSRIRPDSTLDEVFEQSSRELDAGKVGGINVRKEQTGALGDVAPGEQPAGAIAPAPDRNVSAAAERPEVSARPRSKAKQKQVTLLTALRKHGVSNASKSDVVRDKFAPGGYNQVFRNDSRNTIEGLVGSGELDEFLPYELRFETQNDPNSPPPDMQEAAEWIKEKIANGERVIPYDAAVELEQKGYEAQAAIDAVANLLSEDEINAQLQIAAEDQARGRRNAEVFNPANEDIGAESSAGTETREPGQDDEEIAASRAEDERKAANALTTKPVASQKQESVSNKPERDGVRQHVEALIKRRSAANQMGKGRIFDSALSAAKSLLNGDEVKPSKFKNAATALSGDKVMNDALMALHGIAKANVQNQAKEGVETRPESSAGAAESDGAQTDLLGDNTAKQQAVADAERAKDEKRNAGESNANDFTLTGSDRPADQAAARGAQDLFADTGKRPEVKLDVPPEQSGYSLEAHDKVFERVYSGNITSSEFKAAFESFVKNEDEIISGINNLTKQQIFARFPGLTYRYKSDRKEIVSKAAYNSMLDDFSLSNSISYSMGEKYVDVIRRIVDKIGNQELEQYAEKVKASIAERKSNEEKRADGMQNPQTLDDYTNLLRSIMADGKTLADARLELTQEQREEYDNLASAKTRSEREARDKGRKTQVQVTAQTTSGEIIETKHTKTGEDLFVVKAADRVERETYAQWNTTAKRLGGWYSSYRGNGAVPGFQFKARENASAFLQYLGGDAEQAKEALQVRRDAYADDKSQTAVERLTEMADRLEDSANESLGRDRKANTSRRARFAASAEAAANADKAMAQTMRSIADGIKSGAVKMLDKVRQKVQVEMLQSMVRNAHGDMLRKKYDSYAEQVKHSDEAPTKEVADYAVFPTYTAYRSDLASWGRALLENAGTKMLGKRLVDVADDVTDIYLEFARNNLGKVAKFGSSDGKPAVFQTKQQAEAAIERSGFNGRAIVLPFKRGQNIIILSPSEAMKQGEWGGDNDKRITLSPEFGNELVEKFGKLNRTKGVSIPWQLENAYDKRKRLAAMGIETPPEFRAALREFISLRTAPKKADKIKEMERSMIGRKSDGLDFFPTPASVVDEMLEAANATDDMRVLEPSAGMGHIADRMRESGIEPDVIELSGDRRELLTAKGYNLVGNDFLEFSSDEGYDRIIMNPPFGDRRDALHVQHAYSLLKPGGRIVSIMGEGVFFGKDAKAQEFRSWMESLGASDEKLDEGTFQDPSLPVTTGANARMVVIDKPVGDKGVAMFSRATGKGMPAESAQKLVDNLRANWKNAPDIVVVESMNDPAIPQPVRDENERQLSQGATGQPDGFFYKGKVYLVADQLRNDKDVARVLFHETLGHFGLRGAFGKSLNPVLGDIIKYRKADVIAKAKQYGLNPNSMKDLAIAAEEVLAEMAQTHPNSNYVKRAIALIRQVLRDIGIDLELTDSDIIATYLIPARRFVENGGKPGGGIVFSRGGQTAASKSQPTSKSGGVIARDELGRFKVNNTLYEKLVVEKAVELAKRSDFAQAPAELRKMIRKMKADEQNAVEVAGDVAKSMKDIGQPERALVSDVIENMLKTGVTPPDHVVKIAASMSGIMDKQTDDLVALGMLSKDSAERWRGKYLPRFYNRENDPALAELNPFMKAFRTAKPIRGLGGGSLKGRGLYEPVAVSEVEKWEALGWEVRDPLWKKNQQGKLELVSSTNLPDAEKVVMWRDFTPQEREAMGENRDALYRFVMGYTSMQKDIALGRLFDQIAKNQEWVRSRASEGFTLVPDSDIPETGGVKRYGNLAGLYVRDDILSHISQYEASSELMQGYRKALGLWKAGKTVLNPVSHMNNVVSNTTMAHFAGVSYWDAHKYVGAMRDLAKGADMVSEAKEQGLFSGDLSREEFMAEMPDDIKAMMDMQDSALKKGAKAVFKIATFGLAKPMSKAYRLEDDFFKYLIYRDARNNGMAPADAVDYATQFIFTYDDLPKNARRVRDAAIPFFAYTYKAVPALLNTAMYYPWRFAAPAALIAGVNAAAFSMLGDDADEDDERSALPPWMQGRSALGTNKTIRLGNDEKTGLPIYWDVSRFIPGGDLFDVNNQDEGLPLPAPVMPSNPILTSIAALIWNKDTFTGKEVVDKNDTGAEAAEKRAAWAYKTIMPAIAPYNRHWDNLMNSAASELDTVLKTPFKDYTGIGKDGLPVQGKYALMNTVGIKAKPVDLELSKEIAQGQDMSEARSIKSEVRQAARMLDKGAISQEEYDEIERKAMEKIDRIAEKM